jgi:hypothetical protein
MSGCPQRPDCRVRAFYRDKYQISMEGRGYEDRDRRCGQRAHQRCQLARHIEIVGHGSAVDAHPSLSSALFAGFEFPDYCEPFRGPYQGHPRVIRGLLAGCLLDDELPRHDTKSLYQWCDHHASVRALCRIRTTTRDRDSGLPVREITTFEDYLTPCYTGVVHVSATGVFRSLRRTIHTQITSKIADQT